MLRNILTHSLRSFKRRRAYSIINIAGLSIGIACSLLIALYVLHESSYDRFNEKKDRIYRLILDGKIGGQEIKGAFTSAPMGQTMAAEFPEVEDFLRMNGRGPTVVKYGDLTFTEDNLVEADSSFFNFFSIPVLKGDMQNLLNAPRRLVLSESTASKIFGDENPIDKVMRVGSDTADYVVSGVMADVPSNSHFEANILVSFMTNPNSRNPIWLSNSFATYILLRPNTLIAGVDEKLPDLLLKYVGPEVQRFMGISIDDFESQGNRYRFFCQSLRDIHLDPEIQQQFKEPGDPKYLLIFGCISILIVLIAAINFMNLSTAQASRRAKEVGIKKIGGSTRGMLILQFLSESFLLAIISLILAVILIKASLPYFNDLLGSELSLELFGRWYTVPALILFTLFIGTLSGSYPAFFLSSFNPYEVLKGSIRGSMSNGRLRRILVVFQFSVSILLIIGTMIMYRQIRFMLNKEVGFNKENLIVLERAGALGNRVNAFKEAVERIPGVINISNSTAVPGRNNNNNGYLIEGRKDETVLMTTNWVDYDYLDTYEMELSSGRFFEKSYTSDQQACLINEAAMKEFSITDIEKTRFMRPGPDGNLVNLQIIGVVKDFNFESLRNPIRPYVLCFKSEGINFGYLTVRLSSSSLQTAITEIENKWKEFMSNDPLQYYFVDEDFERMYTQEKQNAQLAVIFSILAIFIAALGLFGLTSFTVEQRTKEIGIRKAMGSSVAGIYSVISREVIILVTVSAILAFPLIYYIAGKWLENFYFRMEISLLTFLAGFLVALGVAVATISYRILRAARVNPAQSLKYE